MKIVAIPRDELVAIRIMADLEDKEYFLRCGLVIPVNHITFSDLSWGIYHIYFDDDADAVWFVLNHGGSIVEYEAPKT